MTDIWNKILQAFCGLHGHTWYVSESCGRKVYFCRHCGKMLYEGDKK